MQKHDYSVFCSMAKIVSAIQDVPIITVDGPSGTGKGTISNLLAQHLGWHFLDSGVLYRVLAYAALKYSIDFKAITQLVAQAQSLNLYFGSDLKHNTVICLDGNDISSVIRSEQCAQNASVIASIPAVRKALLERQRDFAVLPGLVADGRDMGTVVFPNAKLKIYLDASIDERASRRFLQLKAIGSHAKLEQVVDELLRRDARDMARISAPLAPATDAIHIDTTGLAITEVFDSIIKLID